MLFLELLVPLCPFPHLVGISFASCVLVTAPPPITIACAAGIVAHDSLLPCPSIPENLSPNPLPSPLPTAPAWTLSGFLTHVCPSPTPASHTPSTKKPERVSDHSDDPVPYLALSSVTRWLGIKATLLLEPQALPIFQDPFSILCHLPQKLPGGAPHLVSHVGCAISHF